MCSVGVTVCGGVITAPASACEGNVTVCIQNSLQVCRQGDSGNQVVRPEIKTLAGSLSGKNLFHSEHRRRRQVFFHGFLADGVGRLLLAQPVYACACEQQGSGLVKGGQGEHHIQSLAPGPAAVRWLVYYDQCAQRQLLPWK